MARARRAFPLLVPLAVVLSAPAQAGPPRGEETEAAELSLDAFEAPGEGQGLPPAPVHTSVCLRLPGYTELSGAARTASLLRHIAPTRIPPGSLYIKYEGLHRFVARRAERRFRSLWGDQLSRLWQESYITDAEMRDLYEQMGNASADMIAGGRWWERSWLDSLPADQGGAPERPYLRQFGEELTILEWGPLEVDNELHARVERVAFGIDPDPGRVYRDLRSLRGSDGPARDHAQLERAILDPDLADDDRPSGRLGHPAFVPFPDLGVRIDLPKPRRRFLENTRWSFGLRPRLKVRPPSSMDVRTWVREVSLEAEVDVYLGERELKVISFELEVTYEPEDNELEAVFDLALAAW